MKAEENMRSGTMGQSPIWMAILVGASLVFSFALACGMPFAALGAIAALTLGVGQALVLAGLAWAINQGVGFGLLGYPATAMTFAWGAAIGLSALASAMGAALAVAGTDRIAPTIRVPVAFVAAWTAQQGTIFAASFVLTSSAEAFAPSVMWLIFWTNALAFAGLLALQWLGGLAGVACPVRLTAPA